VAVKGCGVGKAGVTLWIVGDARVGKRVEASTKTTTEILHVVQNDDVKVE
jgi:hypothetical protein